MITKNFLVLSLNCIIYKLDCKKKINKDKCETKIPKNQIKILQVLRN